MSERKYTLAEIDQMRDFVWTELYPYDGSAYASSGNAARDLIYAQQRQVHSAEVEERLRTYLVAGLGPDDLKREPGDANG